jgi:hypothetical protein
MTLATVNDLTRNGLFDSATVEFWGCSMVRMNLAGICGSSKHGKTVKEMNGISLAAQDGTPSVYLVVHGWVEDYRPAS